MSRHYIGMFGFVTARQPKTNYRGMLKCAPDKVCVSNKLATYDDLNWNVEPIDYFAIRLCVCNVIIQSYIRLL